ARIRCSVVPRLAQAIFGDVEREDSLGAREPRADHRTEPDQPAAEDRDGRSGLDLRGEEGGADSRRESARERRTTVEWSLGVDLRKRDLRHYRVLRERRRAHEVAQRLAAP